MSVDGFSILASYLELIGWDAWKLGGYKAERSENKSAFKPPSFTAFQL
jgi:hypothetical protein